MVSLLFCFLLFTLSVSFTGSYTDDEPIYPTTWLNQLFDSGLSWNVAQNSRPDPIPVIFP